MIKPEFMIETKAESEVSAFLVETMQQKKTEERAPHQVEGLKGLEQLRITFRHREAISNRTVPR